MIDPLTERLSSFIAVMHRLSPPAWKIVSLIAHDDLMRQLKEDSPIHMLIGDVSRMTGIDMSEPAASEERAGLTLVDDPKAPKPRWTQLSLAQICGGVVDRAKRRIENRGTGLPKSTAVEAIKEAVQLGILKKRTHRGPVRGHLPTSYSINWKRVTELAKESKVYSNVKISNKFGRPLPPGAPGGKSA